jgi:hypothetical protein
VSDKVQPWELEHAAKNVAANTSRHDKQCIKKDGIRDCCCSTYDRAKAAVEKSWKAKGWL